MATIRQGELNRTNYSGTVNSRYEPNTFIKPPQVIINQLNAKLMQVPAANNERAAGGSGGIRTTSTC